MAQMTLSQMNGWNIKGDKCHDFVYNPDKQTAIFTDIDSNSARELSFIGEADGLRLWMHYTNSPIWENCLSVTGEPDSVHIPLYKSHVQKCTRRKMYANAIDGVLAILYDDPSSILRRIGIIAIEDVCLVKGYSVIIWLMMAIKYISLTKQDVYNVINYIDNICEIDNVFVNTPRSPVSRKMIMTIKHDNRDEVLALWYRKRAGGMKGDIKMLENAVSYYYREPTKVEERIVWRRFQIDKIALKIPIIKEAIDFHPFPQLIPVLNRRTNIQSKIIKEYIWKVDSAVNYRKPATMASSKTLSQHFVWKQLSSHLHSERKKILVRLGLFVLI